jgi:hypothetical protein
LPTKVINQFDTTMNSLDQFIFSIELTKELLIISSGSRVSDRTNSIMLREDSRDHVSFSGDEPSGAQILFEAA